jgi:sec-independent protein translocase protein TatA
MSPVLAFFGLGGNIGPPELLFLGFVALLLFGKRLPEVMRGFGKSVMEFKKGMSGLQDEFTRSTYGSTEPTYHDRTYHESVRPIPREERPEIRAPKFRPPMSAPAASVPKASAPTVSTPTVSTPTMVSAPASTESQPVNPA